MGSQAGGDPIGQFDLEADALEVACDNRAARRTSARSPWPGALSYGKQRAKPAPEPSLREREVGVLRDRYLAEEIELEEFESEVAEALVARPAEPIQYAERWEIHVHDAPPGHSLHPICRKDDRAAFTDCAAC